MAGSETLPLSADTVLGVAIIGAGVSGLYAGWRLTGADPKGDFSSNPSYYRIKEGYSQLPQKLWQEFKNNKSVIPATCLAGLLLDANGQLSKQEFVLDFAPDFVPHNKNIVIFSSGWAGKFFPLIGKICFQLADTGETEYDISHFKISRSNILVTGK